MKNEIFNPPVSIHEYVESRLNRLKLSLENLGEADLTDKQESLKDILKGQIGELEILISLIENESLKI